MMALRYVHAGYFAWLACIIVVGCAVMRKLWKVTDFPDSI